MQKVGEWIILVENDRRMSKSNIAEKLNNQLENRVPRAEIRELKLEVYPRLIDALEQRAVHCNRCGELYRESDRFTADIVSVVKNTDGIRKEFEKFVTAAFGHLHDEHGALPKGKILSVSVLVGMFTGLSVAVLIGYFMGDEVMRFGAVGWMLGVFAGWVTGKVRESNLKKAGRLF